MKKIYALLFAICLGTNANAIEAGKVAPDFKTVDIDGKAQSISQYKDSIVVLEWNNPECPFVKKFYGVKEMQKLQANAKTDGIVWLTINSSAEGKQGNMTVEQAKQNFAEKEIKSSAYILDANGSIGKAYGAASTPTMVVIDKAGLVRYFGAIDDKPGFKPQDLNGAKNYVTAAIAAVKEGKNPEVTNTKSYGCAVKYAE